MALSPAQQATIQADIAANPDLNSQPNTSDGAFEIARLYNLPSSPAYIVYKSRVPSLELGQVVNYVAVAAMTDTNLNRFTSFLRLNPDSLDPSRPDIQAYFDDIFSGALGGQGANTRAALEALWRRTATRIEAVLATGTGTTASPGLLGFESPVSYQDIQAARNTV